MEVAAAEQSCMSEERFVYVIRESRDLPQINCARALKHVLLAEPRLQLCNRWLSQYKRSLAILFLIGMSLVFVVPFLPVMIGRCIVFFGLLELPALAAAMISLRFDVVRLLFTTYEFWYISSLNVACVVAVTLNYQDVRFLSTLPSFICAEVLALQDANFRALQFTIRIFCVIAIIQVAVILQINLHLIDKWHAMEVLMEVFRYGEHAIMADNIISNYFVFTTIILFRNAYRKQRWVRDSDEGDTTVVRCITYRCRVHLRPQNALKPASERHSTLDTNVVQMRLVPSTQSYDSDQVVLPILLSARRVRNGFTRSPWPRLGLYSVGTIGLALTWTILNIDPSHREPLPHQGGIILASLSPIATGLFCGFISSLYQRQLLRKLITSFDFVFLSTNITAMHFCAGSALSWSSRCLALVSSWLWIMWAITMDALTPDMRQTLGLKRQHLIGVILTFVILVVTFVVELIFLRMWNLHDQVLFQVQAFGPPIQLHVFQLFFSCSVSVLPLCCRILWRLYSAQCDELILIQGAVEYDDDPLARRRKRELETRHNSMKLETTRNSLTSSRVFSWLVGPNKILPAAGPNPNLVQVSG